MKVEGLVADVTYVGSPARAEQKMLGILLGGCLANSGHFCGPEGALWSRNPLQSPNTFTEGHQFNENGVVGYRCNTCRVPCQSGTWHFWNDFEHVLANSGLFCGWEATLWCGNHLLSPNNFTLGHLLKIEWLVTDVTAVRSTDRAKTNTLRIFFGVFWPIQAAFICGGGAILWSGNLFLSPINFT